MPCMYDAIGGRLVQSIGYEAAYIGGYVTGGSTAVTEPLLTMTEQVRLAGGYRAKHHHSRSWPMQAQALESLCTRCARCVSSYATGLPVFTSKTSSIPSARIITSMSCMGYRLRDFVEKIKFSCKQRDETDRDFVIIARTDTCRALGLEEASTRINRAADVGADLGLLFPRNPQEAEQAPKVCRVPLVYVQSRGNRDGRPIFSRQELEQMGYIGCIEAQVIMCTAFHFLKKSLTELRGVPGRQGVKAIS